MSTAQEAAAFNAAIKETELPQVADTPDCSITLLMGLRDVDGVWHTDAVVRELTGEDEEILSGLESKTGVSYADYMTTLLSRAVVSIGEVSVAKFPSVIDELTVADRDLLFIGVIRATYGNIRNLPVKCGACGESHEVGVDLTEGFPVLGTTEELRTPREVVLKDGTVIKTRQPTGADSRFIAKHSKSTAEQNTAIIARCCITDKADPLAWAKRLSVSDRNALIKEIFSKKFGPQIEEVNAPCGHCGENISLTVDWVSLLFG
jgi:hypothetical protein